jgi:hypothetical protein
MAEVFEEEAQTWRQIIDAACEWCIAEGVCLSYLAEQGLIQEGYQGRAYMLPDEAKEYIAQKMITAMQTQPLCVASYRDEKLPDTEGTLLAVTERMRQIDDLNFDDERDSGYTAGELAAAARCYANPVYDDRAVLAPIGWPWSPEAWDPSPGDRIRELSRAGALYMAEQDRVNKVAGGWTPKATELRKNISDVIAQIDKILAVHGDGFNTLQN